MKLIIDVSSITYRAYMAQGGNIKYTFYNHMQTILKKIKPDEIHFVFDSPNGSFIRESLNPDYKKGRPEKSPEYVNGLVELRQALFKSGASIYQRKGVEADDLIASLCKILPGEVFILSADKDLLQLVSYRVTQIRFTKHFGQWSYWTPEKVRSEFGITPEQIPHYLAIVGDKDEVPGLSGVGEIYGTKLIKSYESVPGIFFDLTVNDDRFPVSLINSILKNKELAYNNLKLAKLYDDIIDEAGPGKFSMESFRRAL